MKVTGKPNSWHEAIAQKLHIPIVDLKQQQKLSLYQQLLFLNNNNSIYMRSNNKKVPKPKVSISNNNKIPYVIKRSANKQKQNSLKPRINLKQQHYYTSLKTPIIIDMYYVWLLSDYIILIWCNQRTNARIMLIL